MSVNPYSTTLGDRSVVAPNARNVSNSAVAEADEAFFRCMPRIADYDQEWTSFIEQHTIQRYQSDEAACDPEALPRVWNLPHN
jgi:hypothetical protein